MSHPGQKDFGSLITMYATLLSKSKENVFKICANYISQRAKTAIGSSVQSHKSHIAAASMDVLVEWHMPTEQNSAGGQDTTLQGSLES